MLSPFLLSVVRRYRTTDKSGGGSSRFDGMNSGKANLRDGFSGFQNYSSSSTLTGTPQMQQSVSTWNGSSVGYGTVPSQQPLYQPTPSTITPVVGYSMAPTMPTSTNPSTMAYYSQQPQAQGNQYY